MSQNTSVGSDVVKSNVTIEQAIANYKAKSAARDDFKKLASAVIEQNAKITLSNDCYETALGYTERMLSDTHESINILTGDGQGKFYATLIEHLTAALERIRVSGGTAKMIVLSSTYPEWLKALAQEFPNTFTLARLNTTEPMAHFIVCDSKIVRLEKIHGELTPDSTADSIKATVIFNEPEKGRELEQKFAALWERSEVNNVESSRKPLAPSWIIQRMEALQQRRPPTSQKMRAQWVASMEFNTRLENKQTVS